MSIKIAGRLLTARRFTPLLGATTLGAFNDNLFKMALVVAATAGSFTFLSMPTGALAPMAANAFTAAIFLFSAVAGQVADRFDRSMIMRRAKFAEIFLMALAGIGFLTMNGYILLLTLFLMGIQSAFYNPARVASMPTYLEPKELVPGNALIGGFLFMAILVGGALGTLMVTDHAAKIGGVLVFFAVLGWLAIRFTPPSPAAGDAPRVNWNIFTETVKMISMTLRTPGMARPLLAAAWFWAISAALVTLLPAIVQDVFGQTPELTAALQVLFTIGAATGSIACGVLSRGEDATAFSIVGALGVTVFSAILAALVMTWPSPQQVDVVTWIRDVSHWPLLISFFFAALFAGMFVVPQQALAQKRAPAEIRARLLAGGNLLNAGAATAAQLLLMLNAYLGGSKGAVFVLVAVGSLIAALIILKRVINNHRSAS